MVISSTIGDIASAILLQIFAPIASLQSTNNSTTRISPFEVETSRVIISTTPPPIDNRVLDCLFASAINSFFFNRIFLLISLLVLSKICICALITFELLEELNPPNFLAILAALLQAAITEDSSVAIGINMSL